jgi:hypothetical protein
MSGQRGGGLVFLVIAAIQFYAAWKPDSMPGRLLVSYRTGTRMASIRQYWCGVMGAILVVVGVILFISG